VSRVDLTGGASVNVALSKQPKNQGTNHADNFQTPPSALAPLLPYLDPSWRIWEPACGKGNLVRGLNAAFGPLTCYGSDIAQGEVFDFLTFAPTFFDCIVTNPPFTIKDRWIARCYEIGKPWALLLPLTTFEGQARQKLFREYGVKVILFPKRVHFETPSGKGGSAWFATAWFTWGLGLPNDLVWADPAQYSLFGGDDDPIEQEGVA
jgi:hypothetical protein